MVAPVGWLLLSYRLPRSPSTPRIAVWRRLRRLGVAQLGDGLVALPEDARTREQLEWVAQDIEAADGTAMVWRAELLMLGDDQRLVDQLRAARAKEYLEIIEQAQTVPLDPTGAARLMTNLRAELRRIKRRDYFPPPEAESASWALSGDTALRQAFPAAEARRST
mgnify:CR=1 FL=1